MGRSARRSDADFVHTEGEAMRFESHVDVRRPVGEVFRFVVNGDNLSVWLGGNVELLTPGTLHVGSEFRERTKFGPWTLETRCHITEVEPDRALIYRSASRLLTYEGEVRLEHVPGGTRVTLRGRGHLRGPLRMFTPLLAHDVRQNVEAEASRLQRHIEADAA
jgi:uncharacterized protein YndB with AHSA1/START domain